MVDPVAAYAPQPMAWLALTAAGALWGVLLNVLGRGRGLGRARWWPWPSQLGMLLYGAAAGGALAIPIELLRAAGWDPGPAILSVIAAAWILTLALLSRIGPAPSDPVVPHLIAGVIVLAVALGGGLLIELYTSTWDAYLTF